MQIIKTKRFEIAAITAGDPDAERIAILMPGRLDTKDYINFVSHLSCLAELGFYAVAIDVPGTWDSPGRIEDYSTTLYLETINELIETLDNRPTLLLGHSRGGATAMLASRNPSVIAVVLVNAAYGAPYAIDPSRLVDGVYLEFRDLPPGDKRTEQRREFHLPTNYFDDGAQHDPVAALNDFKGAKLLIHADDDGYVPVETVKEIYNNLDGPKLFATIRSDHNYRLFPDAIRSVEATLKKFIETKL